MKNARFVIPLLVAFCVSCKPAPQKTAAPAPAAGGPQVRATVVTIRTTLQPENRTHTQQLVIAGDRVRGTGEIDTWRLFDTKARTVTFVDDVARTVRTEPLDTLLGRRRGAHAGSLPAHYPRALIRRPGTKKMLQGATAELSVIETGGYRRELWIGAHRAIPAGLFAMMLASEVPSSPLAPMMRAVDEALLETRGFPLADRAELPLGSEKVVVDRQVVSIAERNVAESMVTPPKDYLDLTPRPKPAR